MSEIPYASLAEMQSWSRDKMTCEHPDFIIGDRDNPYLRRWWIIPRNNFQNHYLHEILRSDDDRAGHDHPWPNTSFVIEGGYFEVLYDPERPWIEIGRRWRGAGSVASRKATDTHRLIVPEGGRAVTLFMTGQKERDWGFWCPEGRWIPWREFTAGEHGELVGRGCD